MIKVHNLVDSLNWQCMPVRAFFSWKVPWCLSMVIAPLVLILCIGDLQAQYFGKNKTRYKTFDFEVLQTPNFEIYHYLNDSTANHLAELSERWYRIHQQTFGDTIRYRNPIIFYENHADFQQTAAISGLIGVGTGGVTEALKNRVIMPLMETWSQTDHVLGHELVHAFQYNQLKDSDLLSLNNIRNLPLWMVEGLAEYLSLGRVDANTAMWMRDAVMQHDIPSIKDLNTNPKYFPYRYGQAFWAFIGGVWGDSTVIRLYENVARYGLETAVDSTLHFNTKTLSNMWKASLENHYKGIMKDSVDHPVGKLLIDQHKGGRMNISPALSPNGRFMVFMSEKDLFTIDLYLAEANSGKILRKLSSARKNDHIDEISYVESAGTWSPDSRKFAYVVFGNGINKLAILDVTRNHLERLIELKGVPAFSNPSWSPDGKSILVTGLAHGKSDLYLYDLSGDQVIQLTNDPYSDIQAAWSPDGKRIVFSSDRLSIEDDEHGPLWFNLALMDLNTKEITNLPLFEGADNLNPVFAGDDDILFLSDRDGFRNLYRFRISDNKVSQMTDYFTGISGITAYSPALSYSGSTDELAYSYYAKNGYTIYKAPLQDFDEQEISSDSVDFKAATLPPFQAVKGSFVQDQISTLNNYSPVPTDSLKSVPYKPKFKLDYIGNTTVGVSLSTLGTGLVGGVNTLFSDMLGDNQLFAGLALNGEIYDLGGQVAYFNQKGRIGWGAGLSHIPYRNGSVRFVKDSLQISKDSVIVVDNLSLDLLRTFENQVGMFTFYPFSKTKRLEWSGSFARYNFRIDRYNNYYYSGFKIGEDREKLAAPEGFNLWNTSLALVGDNSHFGVASPLKGHRFRYEVGKYAGGFEFNTILADYRKYVYLKPITLAGRLYHYARLGKDSNNGRLSPLFIGYPTLIRGYDNVSFGSTIGDGSEQLAINDLYGNKMLVANFEIRLPFTGPERLAQIKSGLLFTDLNLFVDAGTVWDPPLVDPGEGGEGKKGNSGRLIMSTGVSMRLNLFGQLIIEPYYAIPLQRNDIRFGTWGLNFTPGW